MHSNIKSAARERARAEQKLQKINRKRTAQLANMKSRRWRPMRAVLNLIGAMGAVGFALTFNLALHPDAMAQDYQGLLALNAGPVSALQPVELDSTAIPAAIVEPDPAEVHLLAATTWAEARSEGEAGMRAVAHVIVNRVGARFGDDLNSVILSPKQFSSWNLHDPNRPLAQNPERYAQSGINKTSWETAQEVAHEVLAGQSADPTGGALFYHTSSVRPWWARFGQGIRTIGAHIFYRDVPDQPQRIRTAARRTVSHRQQASARVGPRAGRVHGMIQHAPAADSSAT